MRIFNTWMGDQSKLVLLKEVVKVTQEEGLLQRVQETGRVLLSGLENIQVITCSCVLHINIILLLHSSLTQRVPQKWLNYTVSES